SRSTICLINFVLSGKAVLLEQPRKSTTKIISHVLTSHSGVIFLHCIPSTRPHLDDPPSISEGWGGRITDYRISDFSELVKENSLAPTPVDRTKIPKVYPEQIALSKLEHATRHWPMVYADTLIYTLTQELDCLPALIKQETMSDPQLEQCRQVITQLYEKEKANEPLSIPTGGRNKGVKRDEQYRSLWSELEDLAHMYSSNSERHRHLLEFLLQMTSRCPSMQLPRKTPPVKTENGSTATESSSN
ncbi:integrator complex subunit 13-like, partial [Halichondria panicea]|uniref:integrator complex subunit 13-like n=1 Tax=Halichondria panicea TaxID=6063 RepID=UPI00312B4605